MPESTTLAQLARLAKSEGLLGMLEAGDVPASLVRGRDGVAMGREGEADRELAVRESGENEEGPVPIECEREGEGSRWEDAGIEGAGEDESEKMRRERPEKRPVEEDGR